MDVGRAPGREHDGADHPVCLGPGLHRDCGREGGQDRLEHGRRQTVTCTGPGVPYADSYGKQSSPECGHTYTRQGRYTVSATSYWTVNWSGIGQTGTIPIDFTTTTNITMGESQVINQ
jgi:hypothetical protein